MKLGNTIIRHDLLGIDLLRYCGKIINTNKKWKFDGRCAGVSKG
jgi:hypothetical protein